MTDIKQVKVAELEGLELDYWVARAIGYLHLGAIGVNHRTTDGTPYCLFGYNDWWKTPEGEYLCGPCYGAPDAYSTDWSQGGPLLERHHIWLSDDDDGIWTASFPPHIDANGKQRIHFGPTPLIAAMRAIVASVYGEEVPNG